MLKVKLSSRTVYNLMIVLLVFSVWAFNETKVITYPIKIAYIVIMGYYAVSRRRIDAKYQLWCLAMIVISVIAMIVAPNFSSASYTFVNMLQVFLIGFVTYGYLDEDKKIDFVLKALIWGGIILAFRLVLVTPANVWISWRRLGDAIGSNSNDVGNKAAISAIIALCMAKRGCDKKRLIYYIAFAALSTIVLFSGSRKSLIAVVTGIILLNTIGLKNKKRIVFVFVIVSALLLIGYHFIMTNRVLYATIGRRIETMIDVLFHGGSEKGSIDLREYYLRIAWSLIKQHPLFGVGLGAYSYVSGVGVYSHCDYTEVICSYGLIGAIVYYYPIFSTTIKYIVWKRKDDKRYIFLIIQLILLITYITMVMYTSAYIQMIIAVFAAYYQLKKTNISPKTEEDKYLTNNACRDLSTPI